MMRFKNLLSVRENELIDLEPGKHLSFSTGSGQFNAEGYLIFPGLVNSHDHLDFNCFPAFKNRIYSNYKEWGNTILKDFRDEIDIVKQIPFEARFKWGMYKNLLNGITAVADHGNRKWKGKTFIDVIAQKQDLHSVAFEKNWKIKLNNISKKNFPLVIHTGEGSDESATTEISRLIDWNLINRDLVGIHGIGMNAKQAGHFKALVWCPASNDFLYGKQPSINELKGRTKILFGTDSTLTASWSIWDHLRLARNTGLMEDAELFDSLCSNPNHSWKMKNADAWQKENFVIARRKNHLNNWDAFYSIMPEDILLIVHDSSIKLIDAELGAIADLPADEFDKIIIGDSVKYVLKGISALVESINHIHPGFQFPFKIYKEPSLMAC